MNRSPMVVGLVATLSLTACEPSFEFERGDTERIIEFLASDELAGRAAFGDEIREAEEFIASEFESAGLRPWAGNDGYIQQFEVHGVELEAAEATLNGESVPSDRILVALGGPEATWSSGDGKPVLVVGPADDPGALVRAVQGAEGEILVLVHPAHLAMFSRLRGFLSQPRYRLGDTEAPSVALLVTADPAVVRYEVRARGTTVSRRLANVVGSVPGRRPDEIVLFSAHHDHIGIRPATDGDSIANGANDDASGTTAVIMLAHYFGSRPQPERTLLFATFTAEEAGGFGSRYFSGALDPDQIAAMFNIEMIGKPAVSGPNTAWVTGWDRSDFGAILERAVEGTDYRFYADPYPDQNLFYRSDNATLARLGVPAHSISTTPIDVDADYHQVTDEVATLDLEHLTNTVEAIARAAETIVSGQETPSRVDPAGLR